jgi:hypothetical protein
MAGQPKGNRLRFRGVRLGILSGGAAGGVTGFVSVIYWSLWSLLPKMLTGQKLAASDPATPRQVLANVLFNATCFGIVAGAIGGATIGAVAGYLIRSSDAHRPRVGFRLGLVLFGLVGVLLRPEGPIAILAFVAISAAIGSLGGHLSDTLFARLYQRGVGAGLER